MACVRGQRGEVDRRLGIGRQHDEDLARGHARERAARAQERQRAPQAADIERVGGAPYDQFMIAVFLGFAMGDLIQFQQMGFGVAVALLLDATVIRSVILPSIMGLLGRWNWYLPRWLEWLPRIEVEVARPARSVR